MQSIAIETFMCLNGITPEYTRDLVKLKDKNSKFIDNAISLSVHEPMSPKYNFSNENMLQLPTV